MDDRNKPIWNDMHYKIIRDLYYADITIQKQPKELKDSFNTVYRSQIAEIHNIDNDALDSIVTHVQQDIPSYKMLIDSLVTEVKLISKEYEKIEIEKPKKDTKSKK